MCEPVNGFPNRETYDLFCWLYDDPDELAKWETELLEFVEANCSFSKESAFLWLASKLKYYFEDAQADIIDAVNSGDAGHLMSFGHDIKRLLDIGSLYRIDWLSVVQSAFGEYLDEIWVRSRRR